MKSKGAEMSFSVVIFSSKMVEKLPLSVVVVEVVVGGGYAIKSDGKERFLVYEDCSS